jgi:RNA-directed DNA polymerase
MCSSRQQAEEVKQRLAEWLAPRGLSFNEDKMGLTRLNGHVAYVVGSTRFYARD